MDRRNIGHMQVPGLTGSDPASLSPAAYGLLRSGNYGGPPFNGPVFTDDHSDSYDVSLSLSRQLSERTSAAINVLHREQDATSNDGYTENRIGVSVSSSFL